MADDDDVLEIADWYSVCNNENESTKKRKRNKHERRFWIRDVIARQDELGEYHRLVQELRHDPKRFYRATACNATHGIAVGILSVCPSICPSVREMRVL